jgi:hypothetical protein
MGPFQQPPRPQWAPKQFSGPPRELFFPMGRRLFQFWELDYGPIFKKKAAAPLAKILAIARMKIPI